MFAALSALFLLIYVKKEHVLWCGLVLIPVVLLISQSPPLKNGVQRIMSDVHNYKQAQQSTSLGFRLQFHNFAQNLLARSPLLGVGTGGFSYYFNTEKPVPAWGSDALIEPHGELWSIAAWI